MEAEISAGKNPFDEWVTLSKANGWRLAIGSGVPSIVAAERAVEQAGGDGGLPWTGGVRAGGAGQSPIRVVSDVAIAGANQIMGRVAHAAGAFPATGDASRLAALWPSSEAVRDWAREVLGDQVVRTESGGARQSVPGHVAAQHVALAVQGDRQGRDRGGEQHGQRRGGAGVLAVRGAAGDEEPADEDDGDQRRVQQRGRRAAAQQQHGRVGPERRGQPQLSHGRPPPAGRRVR
jgi:hypothetical protein